MSVINNSLTLEIVFNDSVSDDFLWILATPPRPPAGGPRGSIFLTWAPPVSVVLKLLLFSYLIQVNYFVK